MGWPALIGLALSAAGTGVNSYAAAQTQKNENATVDAQLLQQQQLQKKSSNIFNENLSNGNDAAGAAKQIGATQAAQNDKYAALAQTPMTGGAGSPVNIDPVVQARADASTQNQGNSAAKLQGYSQWGVNQAIQNMLAGQQIGLVNNQSQQLAQTLGPQLQQASQSEAGLSGLGSLLGTLGSAVGVGGSLAGWGSAAAKAAPTAAQNAGLMAGFGPVSPGYGLSVLPQATAINSARGLFSGARPFSMLGR